MIYYPIQAMVDSGIRDILLICGGNAAGEFLKVLGNGADFGLKRLNYAYQAEPKGIADALGLAEEWAGGEPVCVMLGDNIVEGNFGNAVTEFCNNPVGAVIFGATVEHPEWYGVIWTDCFGKIEAIVEKPKDSTSNLAAIGLYLYDATVWESVKTLVPSKRGELEITDVNNYYLEKKQLDWRPVPGWWADCGESIDGYNDACVKVRSLGFPKLRKV
jgi:glucose-1-phosphate thymidylyltransferase